MNEKLAHPLGWRIILRFWLPLAGTWLMMAAEGALLAAVIARLPDPKVNLAAYGVAFAFAIIVEAPVILLMSASTALVVNRGSYLALRTFTLRLNVCVSAAMLLLILPSIWTTVAGLLDLTPPVSERTREALLLLLPWPAAIGERRFRQGLLIRSGRTGMVAMGTLLRLSTMATVALILASIGSWPGAMVGAAALSSGVLMEMFSVRRMARAAVIELLAREGDGAPTQGQILRFYLPLALTSVLALAVQPVVTFFMGQARMPLESLAVLPVLHGLTFLFRALGLSYQEVGIALMGERGEGLFPLLRFATGLALFNALALGLIAVTPMRILWLRDVSGLSAELAAFAVLPLQLFVPMPVLSVIQSFQRALLVHVQRTAPLSWATALELVAVGGVLWIGIGVFDLIGASAAAVALVAGRSVGSLVLLRPARAAVRAARMDA